jgi:hypothetical protein
VRAASPGPVAVLLAAAWFGAASPVLAGDPEPGPPRAPAFEPPAAPTPPPEHPEHTEAASPGALPGPSAAEPPTAEPPAAEPPAAEPPAAEPPDAEPPASPPAVERAPEPPPATPASPAPATPAPAATPMLPAVPTDATVHIAADYVDTWLELRSIVDGGEWQRACPAPCDQRVTVDGMEARVSAPGMIPSNAFRIEPGAGTARLRVSGGSRTARDLGLVLLGVGLPVTFGGMAGYGIGATQDKSGLVTVGIVGLVVGGLSVAASLPLLMSGATNVRNEKGDSIASTGAWRF